MNAVACPHCGIVLRHTRHDGRCASCGKVLPDELVARPPLPDESLYRDAVAELVRLAQATSYDALSLLNNPRARQLVKMLDKLGGSGLMYLVRDRVRAGEGAERADAILNAWGIIMTFPAARCPECGTSQEEGLFEVVHAHTRQQKHVCGACLTKLMTPPAGEPTGQSSAPRAGTPWWSRLFHRLLGSQTAKTALTPWQPAYAGVPFNFDNVLKVKVTINGEISVDGRAMTHEELTTAMTAFKHANGVVWYYRENPEGEPHPNAMRVIELVTQLKLPIRLCQNPDYSG